MLKRPEHPLDFGGLHRDLGLIGRALDRLDLLRLAIGAGALSLFGCGAATGSDDAGSNAACSLTPEATAGPSPGDGSNGPSVLSQTGVVRRDIRTSFAGLSGTADGVPLRVVLTIVSGSTCAPLTGRAVYIWHCDRLGRFSLYSTGATTQNYLRGVPQTDANGTVTFTSIFPACYAGRWPHIHFNDGLGCIASASGTSSAVARFCTRRSRHGRVRQRRPWIRRRTSSVITVPRWAPCHAHPRLSADSPRFARDASIRTRSPSPAVGTPQH